MVYCGFALLRFIKYVVRSFYHVVRRCQIFRQSWNLHKTGTPTFQTQKKLPLPDRHSRRFDMSPRTAECPTNCCGAAQNSWVFAENVCCMPSKSKVGQVVPGVFSYEKPRRSKLKILIDLVEVQERGWNSPLSKLSTGSADYLTQKWENQLVIDKHAKIVSNPHHSFCCLSPYLHLDHLW